MMANPFEVWQSVYMVGRAEVSHSYDCGIYLLDAGDLVLIDSGIGLSFNKLVANIESLGFDPSKLKAILVTHAHIDHIGSLHQLRKVYGARVIAHQLDAGAIESGKGTGADGYGVDYAPCTVDLKLEGSEASLWFGDCQVNVVHIPGHTPGSIAAYVDISGKRVLFGQDIHGPYLPRWGGDPKLAKKSLQKLLSLDADILCEGHFGIYQPRDTVVQYIQDYIDIL